MSANERKGPAGQKIQVTAPAGGLANGSLYSLATGATGWVGEVVSGGLQGETCVVEVGHQARVPKTTGQAWTQGAKVYKDAETGLATTTSTGNDLLGRATAAATSAAAMGWVQFAPAGG